MGWHSFGDKGQGITGDEPLDIAAAAVERIADAYVARFGRLPLLGEVLHALRAAVVARADERLYDPERLETDWPPPRLPDEAPLDLDRFEAAWGGLPEPKGAYYVSELTTEEDVLRCSIHVDQKILFVDYEVLRAGLNEDDVHRLVLYTLVRDLVGDTHANEANVVSVASSASPARRAVFAYPRPL